MARDAGTGPPEEAPLPGGNVTAGIVRVGDTVRRPAGFWSASVDAFLRHLEAVGFDGAPRSLGFDDRGRHVLEYVEGDVPQPFRPGDHAGAVRRVGRLLRDLHDASAGFVPPAGARWNVVIPPDAEDLVVHHDVAPWNLVCGRRRWVLIDWDGAGPGSRLWDLAYAAHGFVPLEPGVPVSAAAARLAALADGYGLDDTERSGLADLLVRRIESMVDLLRNGHRTGAQPWARLWDEGHGSVWQAHARWAEQRAAALRRALVGADGV